MKLHGSESTLNGSATIDPDEPIESEEEEAAEAPDLSALFDAPSFSDFIKSPPVGQARNYERRVQSMMRAGMLGSLNAGQWADAATFIKYGPGFAKAAGNLAAEDKRAAGFIDMLTAPDSPWITFAFVAIPLAMQLGRNHSSEVVQKADTWRERRAIRKAEKKAGYREPSAPPITMTIFKRQIKLPIRFKIRMPNLGNVIRSMVAPTQHPNQIAEEVLNDPQVVKALHRMGMFPVAHDDAA